MSSNYPELFKTIYNGKTYHQSEGLIPSFSRLIKEKDIEEFSNRYPDLFKTIYNSKTYHQSEKLIPSFSRLDNIEEFTATETESCNKAKKDYTKYYNSCVMLKNNKDDSCWTKGDEKYEILRGLDRTYQRECKLQMDIIPDDTTETQKCNKAKMDYSNFLKSCKEDESCWTSDSKKYKERGELLKKMNQECIFKKSSSVLKKEDIVPKKEKKKSRQASDSSMVKVLNRNKPK